MNELLAKWKALKPGIKAAVVAVPCVVLLSCTCCGGIGVGYVARPDQPNNPWGVPPREWDKMRQEGEKAAKFLTEQNDIKAKYLEIANDADARGDRAASQKAMRDMEEALKRHEAARKRP